LYVTGSSAFRIFEESLRRIPRSILGFRLNFHVAKPASTMTRLWRNAHVSDGDRVFGTHNTATMWRVVQPYIAE